MTLEERFHLCVGRRPSDGELQQLLRAKEAMAVRDDSPAMTLLVAQVAGMATIAAAADQAIGRMTAMLEAQRVPEVSDTLVRQAAADLSAALTRDATPILRRVADEATRSNGAIILARFLHLAAILAVVLLVGAAAGFAGFQAGVGRTGGVYFDHFLQAGNDPSILVPSDACQPVKGFGGECWVRIKRLPSGVVQTGGAAPVQVLPLWAQIVGGFALIVGLPVVGFLVFRRWSGGWRGMTATAVAMGLIAAGLGVVAWMPPASWALLVKLAIGG